MNAIFFFLFFLGGTAVLFTDAELFLSTVLEGAGASASLCVSLLASYAVWLGLMQVWQESGVTKKLSNTLSPLLSRLFKTQNEATVSAISMNLATNMLGIGSASTPYGIEAVKGLASSPQAEYATSLFLLSTLPVSNSSPPPWWGFAPPLGVALLPILSCRLCSLVLFPPCLRAPSCASLSPRKGNAPNENRPCFAYPPTVFTFVCVCLF